MGDSPGKRLALFRASIGLSQRALAAALSVSNSAVGQIEANTVTPSKGFLLKISDVYGVSADWLLNGHGEMIRAPGAGFQGRVHQVEPPDHTRPGHGDVRFDGVEYAFVRRMALSVSAGSGIEEVEGDDAATVALPMLWFSRQGLNSDLCVLVSVRGDSMAPAIPDGAQVLIDVMQKSVAAAGVYAFVMDGQAFVKRLVPSGKAKDGRPTSLMVLSDNQAYQPVALAGAAMNDLRVVGRVRLVLTSL